MVFVSNTIYLAVTSASPTPSMDVAGLVLNAITLPTLLNTCFDIYDKIEASKEAAGDLADLRSRLELELRKLR